MKRLLLVILFFATSIYNGYSFTLLGKSTIKFNHTFLAHKIETDTNKISKGWLQSPYWKNPVVELDRKTRINRTNWIAGTNITLYTGALAGLYTFWYSEYPQTNFHFFNDNAENLQMDKVSHAFGAYMEGRLSIEMWRWAGVSNKKAVLIGGLSGLAYEGVIETLDGFSAGWGWSWGDIGANVFGTTLLLSQELGWHEQRISLRYSTHINSYEEYSPALRNRADILFGTPFFRRLLEDYNTQTYWLSFNLKSFAKNSNIPAWLNLDIGYGVQGIFGSLRNYPEANNIERFRQWYLAPDVDFTKIKTRNRFVKYLFIALNSIKFPTPSVELSQGSLKWNWIHF